MSIYEGARGAADLIGTNLDRLFDRSRDGIVVKVSDPSVEDEDWFNALLENKTIHFEEIASRRMLMIRCGPGFSTGINLDTGEYALRSKTLEPGLLFLARRLAGWENPTGEKPKKVTQRE